MPEKNMILLKERLGLTASETVLELCLHDYITEEGNGHFEDERKA